jgi:hypothetical protein
MLSVTKLPQVMQSATLCTCLGACIKCLHKIAVWEPCAVGDKSIDVQPQQQEQQQQQQELASDAGPQPLHDPVRREPRHDFHRAVLVLAGKFMMAVGAQMQQQAAAQSHVSITWLTQVLLDGEPPFQGVASKDMSSEAVGRLFDVIWLLVENAPLPMLHKSPNSMRFFSSDRSWFDVVRKARILAEVPDENTSQSRQEVAVRLLAAAGPSLMSVAIYMHKWASLELRVWNQAYSQGQADLQREERSIQKAEATIVKLRMQVQCLSPQQRRSLQAAEAGLLSRRQGLQWHRSKWSISNQALKENFRLFDCHARCLQEAGAQLCSLLSTRFCCNNPRCSNMATASEGFLLVRGKSCVCGGCLMGNRRHALAPTFCTATR